jgi:hypothetical protein
MHSTAREDVAMRGFFPALSLPGNLFSTGVLTNGTSGIIVFIMRFRNVFIREKHSPA